jgi:hypothetical protein
MGIKAAYLSGVTKNVGHEIWPREIVHRLTQLDAGSAVNGRACMCLDIAVCAVATMHIEPSRIVLKAYAIVSSMPADRPPLYVEPGRNTLIGPRAHELNAAA